MDSNNEKNYLMIVKNGKFYNAYGTDAYIMNFLFDYRIVGNEKIGFPDSRLQGIITSLEGYKISYQITTSKDDVISKNFKTNNRYKSYAKNALKNVNINIKINTLVRKIREIPQDKIEETVDRMLECIE